MKWLSFLLVALMAMFAVNAAATTGPPGAVDDIGHFYSFGDPFDDAIAIGADIGSSTQLNSSLDAMTAGTFANLCDVNCDNNYDADDANLHLEEGAAYPACNDRTLMWVLTRGSLLSNLT
ncbi:MAG: hypothetical protein WC268_02820 [Patescibacteria group bacterium]|jgi:hypothetical protein